MCDYKILQKAGASLSDGVEIFLTPMEAAQLSAVISKDLNQMIISNVHFIAPGNRKIIIRVVKDSEDLKERTLHQKEKK
jgi:hypothetical protein